MFFQKFFLGLGVLPSQEGIPRGVPSKPLQLLHVPLRSCQGPGLTMKAEERFLCVKRV